MGILTEHTGSLGAQEPIAPGQVFLDSRHDITALRFNQALRLAAVG